MLAIVEELLARDLVVLPANFGVKPLMTPANINWNLRRLFRVHEIPS
jgi:hypothetical protein